MSSTRSPLRRLRPALLTVLAAGALAAGCGGDDDGGGNGGGGAGTQPPAGGATASEGRELFVSEAEPPCATCHTLADADAKGGVGPDLDDLRPDQARVAQAIRNGPGIMPEYAQLSDAQVEALASYVASVAGGGSGGER